MTHLGQRLSALIDGELDSEGRDRVLVHLAGCEPCRAEAVALRTLKRRMNALGGEAEADNTALTGRLVELVGLAASPDGRAPMPFAAWPNASAARLGGRLTWPEARPARYMLGGAFAIFLAGLGTAAFMAGGSPTAPEPEPHVTPAVDVFVLQHDLVGGADTSGTPSPGLGGNTIPNRP